MVGVRFVDFSYEEDSHGRSSPTQAVSTLCEKQFIRKVLSHKFKDKIETDQKNLVQSVIWLKDAIL